MKCNSADVMKFDIYFNNWSSRYAAYVRCISNASLTKVNVRTDLNSRTRGHDQDPAVSSIIDLCRPSKHPRAEKLILGEKLFWFGDVSSRRCGMPLILHLSTVDWSWVSSS